VEFEAVTPEVEELRGGADPEDLVIENARRKAEEGLSMGGGDVALGVDTEVVLEGRLLGKASHEDEARERLEALSGRTHEVLSGVALMGGRERTGVARSLVTFAELSEPVLAAYLARGEWRDRAGAYAIQGLGSVLIARLEGDFSNVVGLPLHLLVEMAPELFPDISSDSAASAENP
jgi:septum formation protein